METHHEKIMTTMPIDPDNKKGRRPKKDYEALMNNGIKDVYGKIPFDKNGNPVETLKGGKKSKRRNTRLRKTKVRKMKLRKTKKHNKK